MTTISSSILVADDDPAMRRLLRTILATQGYSVTEAADASGALEAALISPTADLLLLDLTLPDMDGFKIIQELRASGSTMPIIVLSNRADESAKVMALDLGADDYLTKPFGARELFARMRAAMRHRMQAEGERPIFRAGELSVDLVRRIAILAGEEIKLSPKEYSLLSLLVRNAGKVLTHSHILNELWSGEADTQYIRIYIRSLRQKLREVPENPRYILTEQGVGYRFRDPAEGE
jgi:two-component system, OmpR family, KDP operon response regulator KdpE